jgi:hypothetical protein
VDHVSRLQIRAGGDYGLSCGESATLLADFLAFRQQSRPGSAMDGAIDSATTEQRRVGCIDDSVARLVSDIAHDQFQDGFVSDEVSQAGRHLFIYH